MIDFFNSYALDGFTVLPFFDYDKKGEKNAVVILDVQNAVVVLDVMLKMHLLFCCCCCYLLLLLLF